ncbi:hypothetical protein C8R43DRAFT_1041023 [Mycena crocata]|nr:hypothetical protein C8R43DRAFT_1041023 [Mycena crocata]
MSVLLVQLPPCLLLHLRCQTQVVAAYPRTRRPVHRRCPILAAGAAFPRIRLPNPIQTAPPRQVHRTRHHHLSCTMLPSMQRQIRVPPLRCSLCQALFYVDSGLLSRLPSPSNLWPCGPSCDN